MELTHDTIVALKKEIISECKNIFVQIDVCNENQEKVNSKFANDDKRIDLILQGQEQMRKDNKRAQEANQKSLKFNNWLTSTILGVILTGVITFLFLNFGG